MTTQPAEQYSTTSLTVQFRSYLEQLGYSSGSCNMLPVCVGVFMRRYGIRYPDEIGREQLQDFYEWLHSKPAERRSGSLSEMMIYHYMYSLRTFLNWLERTGQLLHNPISTLKLRRPRYNARLPLDEDQVQELLTSCVGEREEVVLHLFYSCGLRRSEAVALDIRDLSVTDRCLYVRSGKGARRRRIPLTERVCKILSRYVRDYRYGASPRDAFMINRTGRRMSGNSYYLLLKRLLARSRYPELAETVTLHHLRHSIATHLLSHGMSLEFVRDFLGHKHLETTQIYTRINEAQLQAL